jgi:hypothetical protein
MLPTDELITSLVSVRYRIEDESGDKHSAENKAKKTIAP